MALTDKKIASKNLEDTIYNTVTAMASRLVRYNETESNVLVSTLIKLDDLFVFIINVTINLILAL